MSPGPVPFTASQPIANEGPAAGDGETDGLPHRDGFDPIAEAQLAAWKPPRRLSARGAVSKQLDRNDLTESGFQERAGSSGVGGDTIAAGLIWQDRERQAIFVRITSLQCFEGKSKSTGMLFRRTETHICLEVSN